MRRVVSGRADPAGLLRKFLTSAISGRGSRASELGVVACGSSSCLNPLGSVWCCLALLPGLCHLVAISSGGLSLKWSPLAGRFQVLP